MYNTDYEKETEKMLTGKTIKEIGVTGYYIYMKTTDGLVLNYSSFGGGHSCWSIKAEGDEEEED